MIVQPRKTIIVLFLCLFLTLVFAYYSWGQGIYTVYTVFVFGAGFVSFSLALALDIESSKAHEKEVPP